MRSVRGTRVIPGPFIRGVSEEHGKGRCGDVSPFEVALSRSLKKVRQHSVAKQPSRHYIQRRCSTLRQPSFPSTAPHSLSASHPHAPPFTMSASTMHASAALASRAAGVVAGSKKFAQTRRAAGLPALKPLRTRSVVKAAAKSEVRRV